MKHRIINWINSLNNEQSAYLIGFLLLSICLIVSDWVKFEIFWIPFAFVLWGLLIWGLGFINVLTNTILGKAIGGVFIVAATAVNLAIASSGVNYALQVPASPFGYTQTIVAVLSIPFTGALVFLFFSLLLIPLATMSQAGKSDDFMPKGLITFQFLKNKKKESLLLIFGRFIAAFVLLAMSLSFLQNNQPYSETLNRFTRWFAYSFEMETFSYCELGSDTKVAYLGGDNIVTAVIKDESYIFKVETCDYKE